MCLLNLIEKYHRIWFSADCLGQLSALLITDISRRRSDQTGHRILLHIFTHINTDHCIFIIKQCLRQCLGQLCLTDSGRT